MAAAAFLLVEPAVAEPTQLAADVGGLAAVPAALQAVAAALLLLLLLPAAEQGP